MAQEVVLIFFGGERTPNVVLELNLSELELKLNDCLLKEVSEECLVFDRRLERLFLVEEIDEAERVKDHHLWAILRYPVLSLVIIVAVRSFLGSGRVVLTAAKEMNISLFIGTVRTDTFDRTLRRIDALAILERLRTLLSRVQIAAFEQIGAVDCVL